jgi:hypothetical protein
MAKRKKFNKYIVDAFLIIFSVLFALMLNKSFEAYQIRKQARAAHEAIQKELLANESIVNALLETHLSILNTVDSLIAGKNDSLHRAIAGSKYFDVWMLTSNKSIIPAFPSATAWETARSTGIISEFDYSEVVELTRIYTQQEIIYNGTLKSIVDLIFERETNDLKELDATLFQLSIRFKEMSLQERTLKNYLANWRNNLEIP